MSSVTLPVVLALAAESGRICPEPQQWSRLFELLPETRHDGYGSIPGAPLILGAWEETGDEEKLMRFREHLEWAASHGALERVHSYLGSLSESEWHHAGD